jgi:CheY-like chemotaxis protein
VALREVADVATPITGQKKIKLAIDCDETIPLVDADPSKVRQILYNLVSNAVKFSDQGSTVTLSARETDDGVEVSVCDKGIGIHGDDRERIFREFEQVDGSYTRREQGTGLGLALCRSLVEMHGGRIWVESEGRGLGSTFSFILPLRSADQLEEQNSMRDQKLANWTDFDAISALIIEDNAVNMELATVILRSGGIRVISASTAEDGIQLAASMQPHVILMDIALPGMDGLTATKLLGETDATSHIPVIALTAQAMVGDREEALEAGCVAYLTKPFAADDLLQTIYRVTAKFRTAA